MKTEISFRTCVELVAAAVAIVLGVWMVGDNATRVAAIISFAVAALLLVLAARETFSQR